MSLYPAFYVLVLFMAGILIGESLLIPDFVNFCVVTLLFIVTLILVFRRKVRAALVLSAGIAVCLGVLRVNLLSANFPANHISHLVDLDTPITLFGRIVREPDVRPDKTYLTIDADSMLINTRTVPTSGLALIRMGRLEYRFNYGDHIGARGYLSTPVGRRNFHGFDYRRYLGLKRIHSYMSLRTPETIWTVAESTERGFVKSLVIPLRKYIISVFDRHLHGSARHLVAGFLIGETRFIPTEIYDYFRDTGTLHLLAVSGSNVALVILTSILFFRLTGLPKRWIHLISIATVFSFCNLSFKQPSVVRASLMIGSVLLGR